MTTSELTGAALDRAVAKCIGHRVAESYGSYIRIYLPDLKQSEYTLAFCPSTDWAQGGPIIEREKITLDAAMGDVWRAKMEYTNDDSLRPQWSEEDGPTPLIAAMRCYVASKLGDDIEIPKEVTA
jgi:hypothetical protein